MANPSLKVVFAWSNLGGCSFLRISQGQLITCQEKEQGVVLQISTFNPPLYALYALSHFEDTVLRQIVNVVFWGHAFVRISQTVGLAPRPML